MVKRLLISSYIVLVFTSILSAEVGIPYRYPLSVTNSFKSGEYLSYTVSFGFYTGATANLSVNDTIYNGIPSYYIKAHAQTIGVADYLYKIRDRYETIIDSNTHLPHLSIRDINEGRYHHYNEVTYNRKEAEAISKRTGVHKLTADIQDILSTFYFARNNAFSENLNQNQILIFKPFFCDKIFELILQYRGTEMVETKFGEIECYKFSLCERKENKIETLEHMSFWVSRDGNRAPIKVQFEIVVGSFVVELDKYAGVQYPFMFNKSK